MLFYSKIFLIMCDLNTNINTDLNIGINIDLGIGLNNKLGLENILNKDVISIIKPYNNYNNKPDRIKNTRECLKLYFENELRKYDEQGLAECKNNEKPWNLVPGYDLNNLEDTENILNQMEYFDLTPENMSNHINKNQLIKLMLDTMFKKYNTFLTEDPYEFLKIHLINIYYADLQRFLCLENYTDKKFCLHNKDKSFKDEEYYFYKAFPKYPCNKGADASLRLYRSYGIMMIYLIGVYDPNINYCNITKGQLIYILHSKYPELFKNPYFGCSKFKIDPKYIKYYLTENNMENYILEFKNILNDIRIDQGFFNKKKSTKKYDYNDSDDDFDDYADEYKEKYYNDVKYDDYYTKHYDDKHIKNNNNENYNIYDYMSDYCDNDMKINDTKIDDRGYNVRKVRMYDIALYLNDGHYERLTSYLINKIYHNIYNKIKMIPNITKNNNFIHIKDKVSYFHNIHATQGRYYFND